MRYILKINNLIQERLDKTILNIKDFQIIPGQHWVLLGANGSGKTSLIKVISAYEWPTSGEMVLMDKLLGSVSTETFRKGVGIFEPYLQSDVALIPEDTTALEILCTGYDGSLRCYNEYSVAQVDNALSLIQTHFGNNEIAHRSFHMLSSGEKRRILLLRTILNKPLFVILDEPYEFLDIKARIEIELFFNKYFLSDSTRTSLTVVHRVEEVPVYATHAALLKDGEILFSGPIDSVLNSANMSETFGTKLEIRKQLSHFTCTPIL
jgi:iron complex transport system ATP-binding protein